MKNKPDGIAYIILAISVLLVFIFKNNLTEHLPAGILSNTTNLSIDETGGSGAGFMPRTATDTSSGLVMGSRLDINMATAEVLMLIPGIGEKLAARIIKARLERGGFSDMGELTDIKGISDGKLSKLKDFLRVAPVKPSERG